MPELHLPDFRQEYLTGLTFCSAVEVYPNDDFGDVPREGYAWYAPAEVDERAIAVVQFNACPGRDDHGPHHHLHFDIDLEGAAGQVGDIPAVELNELKARALPLFGRKATASVVGRFEVPLDDLPKRGLIRTLVGVKAPVEKWQLRLSGGRFDIDGDTFTSVSWDVEEDGECLIGRIEGEIEWDVDDNLLTNLADLLENGICRILLERSEGEKIHVKPPTMQRKAAE